MSVFVIDKNGKPLLPTCEARARILLRQGKAEVYSVLPFTIRLKRVIENPVGEFKVGIDDGAKVVGISIAYKKRVAFAGNLQLRQDVSRKMLQRLQYRRTRRGRKLCHRKARFLNRGKRKWIPPAVRQKKHSILRVLDDLKKRINVTTCIVEQGQFDTSSMSKGYQLTGKEYQLAEYEGNDWRQKILWRDKYKCQHCKSEVNLQAHHIKPRSQGGPNTIKNGITLCEGCHKTLHAGEWSLKKKPRQFKYPAHTQQGKWWLLNQLQKRFKKVEVCYGWMTAKARRKLNLGKDHHCDASAMIEANKYKCQVYSIKPRRTKVDLYHPTRTCNEKHGFRRMDIVKAGHRTKGSVTGFVRSLAAKSLKIRTSFDDDFAVSYKKSKLLWRPAGLIYCPI
jgi:5-methylcytosine-specific restriction endonuclease McrA